MRGVGLAALLAASAVASTAQAGTYFIAASSDTNTFVVDEDTLKREGDLRKFVLITIVGHDDPMSELGIDYVVEKELVSCRHDNASYAYRMFYSPSNDVIEKHMSPSAEAPIVSGSVMETVEKAVCADSLSAEQAADLVPASTVAGVVEFIHAKNEAAAAPEPAPKPTPKRAHAKHPKGSGSSGAP
jgi:hypothetical protein